MQLPTLFFINLIYKCILPHNCHYTSSWISKKLGVILDYSFLTIQCKFLYIFYWFYLINAFIFKNIFYPHLRTFFSLLFRQRRRGRERGKHQYETEISIGCLFICGPTGDRTCNLDMCSDWVLNPPPRGLWNNAPTNWATSSREPLKCLLNESSWLHLYHNHLSHCFHYFSGYAAIYSPI